MVEKAIIPRRRHWYHLWYQGSMNELVFVQNSWMTVVTPTDRPKSAHNCCVIEVFGGVFVLSLDFLVLGLLSESNLFFFSVCPFDWLPVWDLFWYEPLILWIEIRNNHHIINLNVFGHYKKHRWLCNCFKEPRLNTVKSRLKGACFHGKVENRQFFKRINVDFICIRMKPVTNKIFGKNAQKEID